MTFIQADGHKRKKLKKVWRKPRGLHNKIRLQKKGYPARIKVGYKSPSATRGLVKGLVPVQVSNIAQLEGLDPKTSAIILSSTVGMAKKADIVKTALEKKITMLNLKEPEKYEKKVKEILAERKSKKRVKVKKEIKPKKKLEETLDDEAKAEKEKEDKKKILTKRDQQ